MEIEWARVAVVRDGGGRGRARGEQEPKDVGRRGNWGDEAAFAQTHIRV